MPIDHEKKRRRERHMQARRELGFVAAQGRLINFDRLHHGTTFVWARPTLEKNLKWMFYEWRGLCQKSGPAISRVSLMTLACSRAFGIDRRDLCNTRIRDASLYTPRKYTIALLFKLGHKKQKVALGFGKHVDMPGYAELLKHFDWVENENTSDVRPASFGATKRPLPVRRARELSKDCQEGTT